MWKRVNDVSHPYQNISKSITSKPCYLNKIKHLLKNKHSKLVKTFQRYRTTKLKALTTKFTNYCFALKLDSTPCRTRVINRRTKIPHIFHAVAWSDRSPIIHAVAWSDRSPIIHAEAWSDRSPINQISNFSPDRNL